MSQETKRRQKISWFFSSVKRSAGSFEKVLWLILIFIQMSPCNCVCWTVFCFPEYSVAEPAGPAVWERHMKQVKPGRRPAANHADMKWLKWMLIASHWPVHSLAIYNRKKKKKKCFDPAPTQILLFTYRVTVLNMFSLDLELFQKSAAYFTTLIINTQDSSCSEMLDFISCR